MTEPAETEPIEVEPTELAGKRVLVTGGAGFLGRVLCDRLRHVDATPIVVRSAEVDLTRQAETEEYLGDLRPDVVIHLAAEVGGIGANRDNPGRYFYANATMGIHLIEASRLVGVDKFVQIGTVCAYPKYTPIPFREDDLWEGYPEETNAPYGVAKKSLLVMLDAYRQQYGFNGIYLLPVNLYGPGDNFDLESSHVIPALIRKFTAAVTDGADHVVVWGTGAASREFLHVNDAAEGILRGTQQLHTSEPVNIGASREVTIKDLVGMIGELTGFAGDIIWDTSKPDGQPRRKLDTSRATDLFGFTAQTNLEDGLADTIAWWRANTDTVSS